VSDNPEFYSGKWMDEYAHEITAFHGCMTYLQEKKMDKIAEALANMQSDFNQIVDHHNKAIDELQEAKKVAEKASDDMDTLIKLIRDLKGG